MKKIISVLMVVFMLALNVFALSDAQTFECSDWARESIEKAYELEFLETGGDMREIISREEFCEVIYNYAKKADKLHQGLLLNKFTDTENEKVVMLSAMGIINGKSENLFAPNDSLTREEAATILSRTINKTWDEKAVEERHDTFYDYWDVSDWAIESVQEMYYLGIINGMGTKEDGSVIISPKGTLTKEQAIALVVRVWEKRVLDAEKITDIENVSKDVVIIE